MTRFKGYLATLVLILGFALVLAPRLGLSGQTLSTTQPVSGTVTVTQGTAANLKVDLSGTAANGTAIKVDGSGVTQPVSGTFWQATQPVSGTVTANAGTNLNTSALALDATVTGRLPAGASPADAESNTNTNLSRLGTFNFLYNGTSWDRWRGDTTNGGWVNVKTSVLPTGAATAAKQPALGTAGSASSDVITIQGIASMTKLLVTPDSVALPAHQSTNVDQLNGTTTDTNSGNKSAGTLRVVLATDQPALTNKLLVTPDANSAINVGQVGGSSTATAATGVQKVGVVGNAGGAFDAATGAAPPANAVYIAGIVSGATGGLLGGVTACDKDAVINISTATTTSVIAGVSSRKVHICSIVLVNNAADNVAFIEGTTTTTACDTGAAGMAGGTTAASGFNFAANGGLTLGGGFGEVMATATNADNVCIVTSAATQLSGHIKYAIY